MWILAPKLPNSDLKIAVDFLGGFFPPVSPRKKARKNPPKNPRQNSPGNSVGKIPLGFLQKPSLEKWTEIKLSGWDGRGGCRDGGGCKGKRKSLHS